MHSCTYQRISRWLIALGAFGYILQANSVLAASVWSAPTVVTMANDPNPNDGQQVAINASGRISTAWNNPAGVQARIKTGNKWSAIITLEAGSTLIDLAEAGDNSAIAIIKSAAGVYKSSFYNPIIAQWTLPTNLPVTAGQTLNVVKARFDGQSNATLVWVETTATPAVCSVQASQGTYTGGWGAVKMISASNECFTHVDLALNKRGEAAVGLGAFHAVRHGGVSAYVTSRNIAGAWTGLTLLGYGPYQTQTKVAIANNGVAIASYSDANLGVQWSRRSPIDSTWTAATIIDGGVPAVDTAVAIDTAGNAVIVYPSYYPILPPASLQAVRLKAGSNMWTVPVAITDATNSDITSFDLAVTPGGSIIASWADEGTLSATAPVSASASLGVSVLVSGSTVWSNTVLDWCYNYIPPTSNAIRVTAASGRAAVLWNAYDVTGVYQSVKLATTTVK